MLSEQRFVIEESTKVTHLLSVVYRLEVKCSGRYKKGALARSETTTDWNKNKGSDLQWSFTNFKP